MSSEVKDQKTGAPKLSAGERRLVLALLIALFVSGLDASVVNVMLPKLQTELSISMEKATLLASVYITLMAALGLPLGRCADLFSPVRIFTVGVFFFGSGSLICGLAHTFVSVLGGRAIQGVGAAMLAASFGAVIIRSLHQERSGSTVGAAMMVMSVGSLVGPPLGGFFASKLSWQWAFLVNVPLCFIAVALLLPSWNQDGPPQKDIGLHSFDPGGSFLGAVVLLSFPAGLHLVSTDGWGSPKVWGILTCSFLATLAFLRVERNAKNPLLPPTLFSSTKVKGLAVLKILVFLTLNGVLLVYPFFIDSRSNLHVGDAGWLMLASAIAMTVLTPVGGKLCDRLGGGKVMLLGSVICCAVTLASFEIGDQPSRLSLALSLAGLGAGISLVLVSSTVSFLRLAPPDHAGIFSAVNSLLAPLGGAIGMSVYPLIYSDSGFRASLAGVLVGGALMVVFSLFLGRGEAEGS